jgi:hypothetical protein
VLAKSTPVELAGSSLKSVFGGWLQFIRLNSIEVCRSITKYLPGRKKRNLLLKENRVDTAIGEFIAHFEPSK